MAKLIADRPDFVFTTSTRPWNIKPGDVMPGTYIGIWESFSKNNIPVLAMRDTPWLTRNGKPFFPYDCLAKGGDSVSCGIERSKVLSITTHVGFRRKVSPAQATRHERCGVPEGLLSCGRGKCVALSRFPPPLDHLHAHHDG